MLSPQERLLMTDWQKEIDSFLEVQVYSPDKKFMLDWEYIGEGHLGEFDESDGEDIPLLRFAVYVSKNENIWEIMDDASYCTSNPINTNNEDLVKMGQFILDLFSECYNTDQSWKHTMESASWITPDKMEV
jgi:hypothetical protein